MGSWGHGVSNAGGIVFGKKSRENHKKKLFTSSHIPHAHLLHYLSSVSVSEFFRSFGGDQVPWTFCSEKKIPI